MSAPSFLFVLNEAPNGNERVYNALRLAGSLARRENLSVKVFLLGDAAAAAKQPAGARRLLQRPEHALGCDEARW